MSGARHSQILWKISVLMGACFSAFPACAQYSGGSGTARDPYQIATAADLVDLGERPTDYDKHFALVADIDLDPKLPGGQVFDKAVIAPGSFYNNKYSPFQGTPFTGVLNGDKHTISHLTITGKDCLGPFGQLRSEAQVKNLGVVDVNITGSGYYAGGLVGHNAASSVTHCYSTGVVRGGQYVGGLVGENEGTVTHCYSTGAVSGRDGFGGLMGYARGAVTGCFWDTQTSGQAKSAVGAGKTTAEMQTAGTFLETGWGFVTEAQDGASRIWRMPQGGGYPVLAIFAGYTAPQLQGSSFLACRPDYVNRWLEYRPCLQVTAASLIGEFGWRCEEAAWAFLHGDLPVVVATDAHDVLSRAPRMTAAYRRLSRQLGRSAAQTVCMENGRRLVAGQRIVKLSGTLPRREPI